MNRWSTGECKENWESRIGGQLPATGKPGGSSFGKPRPTLGCRGTDDDDNNDVVAVGLSETTATCVRALFTVVWQQLKNGRCHTSAISALDTS